MTHDIDCLFCITVRVKCLRINPITAWKWDLSLLKDEPRWLIWILYSRISHVHFLWFSRFQNATLEMCPVRFKNNSSKLLFRFYICFNALGDKNHVGDRTTKMAIWSWWWHFMFGTISHQHHVWDVDDQFPMLVQIFDFGDTTSHRNFSFVNMKFEMLKYRKCFNADL